MSELTKQPKSCKHKKHNRGLGYIQWHSWAEKQMAKGKKQTQCPKCNGWFFKEEVGGY